MKKTIQYMVFICVLMVFIYPVYAKTYVIYKNDTKEIISISPEDDAVVVEGQTKVVLEDNFKDIKLTAMPTDYKFINGNFVKDTDKISDKINAQIKGEKKVKELRKIEQKMQKMACEALEAEGVKFDELKCKDL